jgi:maleamate amidohydrolase
MALETYPEYERARLSGRFTAPERPAVVVVDLIRAFTSPSHPLGSELGEVIAATSVLVDLARRQGHPVVFTTIAYDRDTEELGRWVEKIPALSTLRRGSEWVEVDERIPRRDDEPLIAKKGASAAFGTDLVPRLGRAGVDGVVLTGASTSGCVRATAVDLVQSGFSVVIPHAAVGDRSAAAHRASLIDLDAKYADVVSLAQARALLVERAGE